MATEVWISPATDPDRSALGPEWRVVGELDEGRETDLWKVVQGYLGYRAFSKQRSVQFYADLDADSVGYQELLGAQPGVPRELSVAGSSASFWLALRWAGPPPRTFFASQQASLAHLARRQPESHPGRLLKPRVPVGMRLHASEGGFFEVS